MMLSYSRWAAASAARAGPLPSTTCTAAAALSSLSGRGPFRVGPEPSPPPPGRSGRERSRLCPSFRQVGRRHSSSAVVESSSSSSSSSFDICRRRRIAEFSTSAAADVAAPTDYSAVNGGQSPSPPFSKILIANRGEIALRVIKTCRSLGIRTVAVHSTVDYRSPHVLAADESVCVGPAASSESYLNVDAVCKAIADTGAEAVHPGYGFLSENAEFARRVAEMGAAFIGPSSDAIVAMGDKIQSKKLAREAKVNVIPGYDGVISSPEEAVKIAEEVGYPVMIKATAGGGGKGMRICHNAEQVVEGYHLSTAEAKSFFSDDRLFIERYIEDPHHIEIQVLAGRKRLNATTKSDPKSVPMGMNAFSVADGEEDDERYGPLEILCFPERECSIQRRNQKIIEESPSTLLTPETRAEMVRQVKSLVRRVNYQSAGTVEFLVDEKQNFYFLEMNTRLQVEHPVTEMVSGGVDLVRGMIDVAGGRGVPEDYLALVGRDGSAQGIGEDEELDDEEEGRVVPHSGHAIEARIYAEDPLRGFLPSIGPLLSYVEPPCISHTPTYSPSDSTLVDSEDGSVVRIDSGVTAGSQISQYYDPMISKLVAYSPHSRSDAIRALGRALDRYVIRGVGHNASFASDVLRHPQFIEGRTPTNFIERNYPEGFSGVQLTEGEREELAVVGAALSREKERSVRQTEKEEEEVVIAMLGGMFGDAYRVKLDAGDGPATVEKLPPRPSDSETMPEEEDSTSPSRSVSVTVPSYDPVSPVAEVLVDSNPRSIQVGSPNSSDKDGSIPLQMYGASVPVLILSPREYELSLRMLPPAVADTSDMVLSPMPGTLVSYAVEEGERVEVGQEICVVEAMKMQNVIRAERAGVVSGRKAEVGESLMADEVIVEFEKEGGGEEEVA